MDTPSRFAHSALPEPGQRVLASTSGMSIMYVHSVHTEQLCALHTVLNVKLNVCNPFFGHWPTLTVFLQSHLGWQLQDRSLHHASILRCFQLRAEGITEVLCFLKSRNQNSLDDLCKLPCYVDTKGVVDATKASRVVPIENMLCVKINFSSEITIKKPKLQDYHHFVCLPYCCAVKLVIQWMHCLNVVIPYSWVLVQSLRVQ